MIVGSLYWGTRANNIFIYLLIENTQTGYKPSEAFSSIKSVPKRPQPVVGEGSGRDKKK